MSLVSEFLQVKYMQIRSFSEYMRLSDPRHPSGNTFVNLLLLLLLIQYYNLMLPHQEFWGKEMLYHNRSTHDYSKPEAV